MSTPPLMESRLQPNSCSQPTLLQQTPKAVVMMTPRPSPKATYESVVSLYGNDSDEGGAAAIGIDSGVHSPPPKQKAKQLAGPSDAKTEKQWAAMEELSLAGSSTAAGMPEPAPEPAVLKKPVKMKKPVKNKAAAASSMQ